MHTLMLRFRTLVILLLAAALSPSLLAQVQVTATFEPDTIYMGSYTNYKLTVRNSGHTPEELTMSRPASLIFSPNASVGINHTFINGRASKQTTYAWSVRPNEAGEFTIESYTLKLGNKEYTVPAATLTVLKSGQTPPATSSRQTIGKQPYWMKLELPRENIYANELVQANLKLYYRNDSRLEKIDDLLYEGDSFTNPKHLGGTATQEMVQGERVNVQNIQIQFRPLKSGKLDFTLSAILLVLDPNAQHQLNDPFDMFRQMRSNPGLGGMFGLKRDRITTENPTIEVLPLPAEGKPESFTGAIGLFGIAEPDLSDANPQVGDPITLTLEITGTGNFEAFTPPNLKSNGEWRSYEPETTFIPNDESGATGTLKINYLIAAQNESVTQTPDFKFSFFNPDTAEYITLDVPRKSVSIRPSPIQPSAPSPVVTTPDPAEQRAPEPEVKKESLQRGLLSIKLDDTESPRESLTPIVRSPAFLIGNAFALALFLAAAGFRIRYLKRKADAALQARLRAEKAAAEATEHARLAQDAQAFYSASCKAIEYTLDAQNLTREALDTTAPQLARTLSTYYITADAARYGGITPPDFRPDLAFAELKQILHEIKEAAQ